MMKTDEVNELSKARGDYKACAVPHRSYVSAPRATGVVGGMAIFVERLELTIADVA